MNASNEILLLTKGFSSLILTDPCFQPPGFAGLIGLID